MKSESSLSDKPKPDTVMIGGIEYEVIAVKPFEADGKKRHHLRLRRPNGTRIYFAVRYETGELSSAVGVA